MIDNDETYMLLSDMYERAMWHLSHGTYVKQPQHVTNLESFLEETKIYYDNILNLLMEYARRRSLDD